MTDLKPDVSITQRSQGGLFDTIKEITQLENHVVSLKKRLLLESAQGFGEEQFENPSFLLVKSAEQTFAAPLKYVNEIVEMPLIMPLPNPISSIAGMVNYHGELLAVIDIEELTRGTTTPVSPSQVLLICTIEQRHLALKVDEAIEVVTMDASAITMSDSVMPGIMKSSGMLKISPVKSALILDLIWIGVGAHLGRILSSDAATPKE